MHISVLYSSANPKSAFVMSKVSSPFINKDFDNKLANKFSRIKNYNIAVKEVGQEIVFMHKLLPGGTDQSYGIHVAELAGMPASVVFRAKEIQDILQREDDMMKKLQAKKLKEQMSLDGF